MVKAGAWGENAAQLHRFLSWDQVRAPMTSPYCVEAEDCYVDGTKTYGRISIPEEEAKAHPEWMCQSGAIQWNLKIDKKVALNVGYGVGKGVRKLQLFEMFWHAEGMKTAFSGEVTWNGGNRKGAIFLYRDGKLVDQVLAGRIGCEYGEDC